MSDFIPPEVVTKILTGLPAKSLLRFRCVCKRWLSLISSPNFISNHLSHSSSTSTNTLVRHYSKLYSKEIYTLHNHSDISSDSSTRIPFPFHKKARFYTRVVAYSHGILCLADDLFGYTDSITLWNPSIQRAVSLPTPKFVYSKCGPHMIALGFGFDQKSKDYKVVRVCYKIPDELPTYELPPKVEVFRVSTAKWTTIKPNKNLNKMKILITEKFWAQVVFEGFLHWNGYKLVKGNQGRMTNSNVIVKFDLGKEVFEELSLPQVLAKMPPMCIFPSILGGEFSVVFYDHLAGSGRCSIWVMKEYGDVGSWTEMYKVDLGMELGMVLGMRRDGEMMFTAKTGELLSYDFESRRFSSTGMLGSAYSFFLDDYVESLVLFDKGKSVKKKEVVEIDDENKDANVEKVEASRRELVLMFISTMINI